MPEDWAGAYKLANEKISWRNGTKIIIHLTDAGAHGKLFTRSDKYPEEEQKLVQELEKCALKKIKIFGYIIKLYSQSPIPNPQSPFIISYIKYLNILYQIKIIK